MSRIRSHISRVWHAGWQLKLDEDKAKYPFVWLNLLHPNVGFDPKKNPQAKLQLSLQVLQ